MEEDEIQAQACKFPRVGNGGRNDPNNKIGPRDHHDEDVENGSGGGGELIRGRRGGASDGSTTNRLDGWHHSSRIIRVSRASGGKDRHSKVMTSKGLRDRRVRLSVTTAIQFYDLQDRLGYDQPSKAVEWLIKSASDAIAELPSLNTTFPDTPKQPSDEKRASVGTEQGFDSADAELEGDGNYNHQQNQSQNLSLSKSACSSTSETSKGSGLSLSRSDIRVKARERARERAAKEKKKDTNNNNEPHHQINAHQQMNPISQTASFTELLTGGINNAVPTTTSPTGSIHQNHGSDEPNLFNKAARQQQQQQWGSAPMAMDYFSPVFLGPSSSSRTQQQQHHHHNNQSCSSAGFLASQIQLGHSLAEAMSFNVSGGGDQNHSLDCMRCLKSKPECGFCASGSNKLLPGACLASNDITKGQCKNDRRAWYTRGCPSKFGWLALIGLALYIIFFSPGMGTVPWVVNSEIYPLRYRGVCGGIASTTVWVSNLIVSQSFLPLTQAIGTAWTFMMFGFVASVGIFFVIILFLKPRVFQSRRLRPCWNKELCSLSSGRGQVVPRSTDLV